MQLGVRVRERKKKSGICILVTHGHNKFACMVRIIIFKVHSDKFTLMHTDILSLKEFLLQIGFYRIGYAH